VVKVTLWLADLSASIHICGSVGAEVSIKQTGVRHDKPPHLLYKHYRQVSRIVISNGKY
jgi:hypothetical protein